MTFDGVVERASKKRLMSADIAALCSRIGGPVDSALDAIALELATRYTKGALRFSVADFIANHLFGYGSVIGLHPDFMTSIFLAFDSGEFVPRQDPPDTNPEEKYTKPLIAAALAKVAVAS